MRLYTALTSTVRYLNLDRDLEAMGTRRVGEICIAAVSHAGQRSGVEYAI